MKLKSRDTLKWIAIITIIVGTTDALGAIIIYPADPLRLFQLIASGLVGKQMAYSSGYLTFALGVLLHYFIATSWTVIYFILYSRLAWLRKNKIFVIVMYALLIWTVMNLLVLPLSWAGLRIPAFKQFPVGLAIIIFAVSLPIVLLTDRASRLARVKAGPV